MTQIDKAIAEQKAKLEAEVQARYEKARTGPASWGWTGPARNLINYGFQIGQSSLRRLAGIRWYAFDKLSAKQMAAFATACTKVGRDVVPALAVFAEVMPSWQQQRPAADAGTLEPVPKDALGNEIGNPWMPEHKDIGSQVLIKDAAPNLARWMEKCAAHGGKPTAKMLVEFEQERERAENMRRVCDSYNDKLWAENKLRRDPEAWPDGFNLTQQGLWTKAIEAKDRWLVEQHRTEAKQGAIRLGFDNHTLTNVLAKRDPQLREIHKQAKAILEQWQAEEQA